MIGSASPGRLVIGSRVLTRVRSLALGFPSVGPTCTRWLKFVGGDMSLERTKGSFSISLRAEGVRNRAAKAKSLHPPCAAGAGLCFAPPPRARGHAHQLHRARAPALLLFLLLRHSEKEAALALGAEQLAPAVVGKIRDVELVLLCGRSRELGGTHKSPGSQTHTCAQVSAHLPIHVHICTHFPSPASRFLR